MHNDHWYILGAGSVGCLWAASLCHKGMITHMILKERRYQQLPHKDITLKLLSSGQTEEFNVKIISPETINSKIKKLIVCTKAQDTLNAMTSIREHLSQHCCILLLQNGMDSQQSISKLFPNHNIWAGCSTDGAYLSSPFEVCHSGHGETLLGHLSGRCNTTEIFHELFNSFRLKIIYCNRIEQKMWEKLAVNCCINGLTAWFNCRNGELLDGGEKQDWLDQLIIETNIILTALKIPLDSLKDQVYGVCRLTANNISSTCQDVRNGRSTELSFLNGFLIKHANQLGIAATKHHQLMNQLKTSGIQ